MKKIIDIRMLLPNLVTLTAICAGLTAIRFTFEGNFSIAMIAVLIAAVLDGLDGRIARALKATSRFGAELDSLADAINFGVVPALILYIWDLKNHGNLGWLACLIFAIAMVLRLARFNTQNIPDNDFFSDVAHHVIEPKAYFIGVPAPIGAILVLLPIYLSLAGGHISDSLSSATALYVIMVAGFSISTLKTFSLKAIRFNAKSAIPVMFAIAMLAALLFSFTWSGLALVCLAYIGYLLLALCRAVLRFKKISKLSNNS